MTTFIYIVLMVLFSIKYGVWGLMRRFFSVLIIIFAVLGIVSTIFYAKYFFDKITNCEHSSYTQTIIFPTCTEGGKTINKCDRCSYEFVSDITPPCEHDCSSITVAPTCTAQGYTLNYCLCGYSYTSDFTSPLSHSLVCETITPNCTEQGYSNYSCKDCDYKFKSDFTKPVGHSFISTEHLPTAFCAGYTEYNCECDYKYVGNHTFYSDIFESAYVDNTQVLAKGLDVSRWNHQIDPISGEYLPLDWELIKKSGFDFVILKAGSTKSGIEPTFESDYSGARAAGLMIGAYFYTYSSTVSGTVKDAEMLISWLKGKQFEYPIYLDLEDGSLSGLGKKQLGDMCSAFLEILQSNGYYVGLYTNHTWLTSILDTTRMTSLFDIWYARYPGTSVPAWNEEKYGEQLGMWQYTQSGVIEGIEGSFDLNFSYKDYMQIMKKWGLNGYSKD